MSFSDKKITFLLADDHSLMRQGIVFILEDIELDFEVVHASTLQKALEAVKSNPIDIAIIDAHFPDGNSLSILPEIKTINPDIKIMIFSGIDENVHVLKYINAGANGFLSKLSEEDDVKTAIQRMLQFGEYISPVTQALLINSVRNPKLVNPLLSLTEKEMTIAKMYAEGLGNLEIANKLEVKQNTVSTVKKRIFEKLKIDNIVDLIDLLKEHQ